MHPAEEIEAYAKLIEEGIRSSTWWSCFGVPPLVVTQRMKLTRVSALFFNAAAAGTVSRRCAGPSAVHLAWMNHLIGITSCKGTLV